MAQNVYQPDPTAGKDSELDSAYPDTNYGSEVDLVCGYSAAKPSGAFRLIFEFDISDIPAGSTIDPTSKFEMYVNFAGNAASSAFTVHRCTRADWVEDQATWNIYKTGSNWTTGGGDYSTPTVPFTGPALNATGWLTITDADLAAFLQDALDNQVGKVITIIRKDDETVQDNWRVWSSDYLDDSTLRPKLTVDYTLPGAGIMTPRTKYWGDL